MIWIDEPYRNGGFGKKVVHLHSHRFLLATFCMEQGQI
jgi:hypothetical protein